MRFSLFSPTPQTAPRASALGDRSRPHADPEPGRSSAEDDLSLYSRLERDALLLSFGDAADGDAARDHGPAERLWRFAGMLQPPYT